MQKVIHLTYEKYMKVMELLRENSPFAKEPGKLIAAFEISKNSRTHLDIVGKLSGTPLFGFDVGRLLALSSRTLPFTLDGVTRHFEYVLFEMVKSKGSSESEEEERFFYLKPEDYIYLVYFQLPRQIEEVQVSGSRKAGKTPLQEKAVYKYLDRFTSSGTENFEQSEFNQMIGELDLVLSKLIRFSKLPSNILGPDNIQTLKHHSEDCILAASKVLDEIGIYIEDCSQLSDFIEDLQSPCFE